MNKIKLNRIANSLFIQSGYVLDFTNKSFSNFVFSSIEINIYEDDNYTAAMSKGKKLISIINNEDDQIVHQLMTDLLNYYTVYLKDENNSKITPVQRRNMSELQEILEAFKKDKTTRPLPKDTIIEKFKEISTRSAAFTEMADDEKIKEINNLIENMLKVDNKYIEIEVKLISFGLIDNNIPKQYRNLTQIFRHSTEKMLTERNEMSKANKDFLIDFGIMLINLIHASLYNGK